MSKQPSNIHAPVEGVIESAYDDKGNLKPYATRRAAAETAARKALIARFDAEQVWAELYETELRARGIEPGRKKSSGVTKKAVADRMSDPVFAAKVAALMAEEEEAASA